MTSTYVDNQECYDYVIKGATIQYALLNTQSRSLATLMIYNIMSVLNGALQRTYCETTYEETLKFICWAYRHNYSLDWRLFVYFSLFKHEINQPLCVDTLNDLFIFSVSQWTYCDKSDKKEIHITSRWFTNIYFKAIKSRNASIARKISIVQGELGNTVQLNEETEIAFF